MGENDLIYPLVSLCVPVYNAGAFIVQTLTCLCMQDYPNIEIIVVNDGSTDDTAGLIKTVSDSRINLIHTDNGGAARARNIGFDHSKGRYIIYFDADDYVFPDYITQQYHKIKDQDDIVVMACWGRFYNNNLAAFGEEPIPPGPMSFTEWIKFYWYNANPMTNPGRVMIPRQLLGEAGRWNERLSLNDDFEFFTRVFLSVRKIVFNSDAKFYYRSGVAGLSASNSHEAHVSFYNSIALSVDRVVAAYDNDPLLLRSCANMWQLFVYSTYPANPELIKKAEKQIEILGGADLPFPSGKITSLLTIFFGWKLLKKIRSYL
ncbi:glycosyltransferase [Mucilaginibacter sp. BJC16-A38]|uniref:glycosyltransferase family 2 protein n=1 Tax=Mucilaginibacter phenanthrenivorans TaxID=1234842 RepID=UPI002158782C|nr:glycosyltransferase family 2 protein [Mucilaginibacter phenanthrenivorans]MCR8560177.1 glycosyltransferase [Mucilaginibacter phenanthrenivorans]